MVSVNLDVVASADVVASILLLQSPSGAERTGRGEPENWMPVNSDCIIEWSINIRLQIHLC